MNPEVDFVRFVVNSIVERPDSFDINRSVDDNGVLITLAIDEASLGRVIGRSGATVNSIRNILRALAVKNSAKYRLKIVERL